MPHTPKQREEAERKRGISLGRKERLELATSRAKAAGLPPPILTPTAARGGIIEPEVSEQEKKLKERLAAKELLAGREQIEEPVLPIPEVVTEQQLAEQQQLEGPLAGTPLGEAFGPEGTLGARAGLAFAALPVGKIVKVGKGLSVAVSKQALTTAATKTKLATGLKSITTAFATKAFKTGAGVVVAVFGIGKIIGQPVSRLQSIDTALGQIRETITAPVAGVRNGAFSPSEGLDMLDDLEEAINEYERSLKTLEKKVFLTTLNREKMDSAKIRVRKLKRFIDVGRQDIALVAVSPVAPDSELIAIMLDDLKNV